MALIPAAYSIETRGTVSTLLPTDTLGATHAGVDVQIALRSLSTALNTVYSGLLALIQPTAMQVYQRDTRSGGAFGLGMGLVSFSINFSQPATLLEYQLLDASSNVVLLTWTQAAVAISAGAQTISFSIPASLHWYVVQFRANSDITSLVATTNRIGVGEVVAFSGQSLAVDFVTQYITGDPATLASLGLTVNAYGPVMAAYGNSDGNGNTYGTSAASPYAINYPPAWVLPADGTEINGSFVVQFLNLAIAKLGVPVAFAGLAVGATTLAQWQAGFTVASGFPIYPYLVNVLNLSGAKFGCMLWMQGHGDIKIGTPTATVQAALGTLFASLRNAFSNGFALVLASIPGLPAGYAGATGPSTEAVRLGYLQYAAAVGALYVDGHDAALFNTGGVPGVHPSQAGNVTLANHFFRAFLKAIGQAPYGDTGPLITGASRLYGSPYIGLTVSQPNGGTTLTQVGTITSLFQVYPSGTTTATYTVATATIQNSGSITLGITPAPIEPASIDTWIYYPTLDTNTSVAAGIYDNVTGDGVINGRLLAMVPTAITALSPQVYLTVGAVGGTTTGATIAVSGTYGNGTPGGLEYSFNGGAFIAAAATIGSDAFSFSATAPAVGGTYTMLVQDTVSGGNTATNSFVVSGNSLTVTTPSSGTAGASVSVAGTYSNGTPAALDYSYDGGNTWTAASGPTISGGNYSFAIASGLPVGCFAMTVRDHTSLASGTSPTTFSMTTTGSTAALPTLSASQVPILHFDAANASAQLYTGIALTGQAANGSLVAGFKDLSTSANNFVQATSGQRPTLQASIKNGLPGLRFTGAAYQFLQAVSTSLPLALQASTNFGALVIFTPATVVSSTQIAAEVFTAGLNSQNAVNHTKMLQVRSNGAAYFENNGASTNNLNVAISLSANTIYKCVSRWTAGTQALAINALTEGTVSGLTGPSGATWNFAYIGAGDDASVTGASTYSATYPFDGWVHEIVIYNAALTTADRASLLTYATTKWGS